jgi:lysophospholipid acyltransferase (LPLAT)-like uncharacterized protein
VPALRAIIGVLLGTVARVWLATLRVRVTCDARLEAAAGKPWVLAFFHGTQWPLLAWKRRRRTVVLVSLSSDGAMQARALGALGLAVVRGSSSRGGARGLAALVRRMRRESMDAAFAVDGPRGPYGGVKGGALVAAHAASAVLVPMGSAMARGFVLRRAWDRFAVAWPFSRVAVVLGAPIDAGTPGARSLVELAIARANADAARSLDGEHATSPAWPTAAS